MQEMWVRSLGWEGPLEKEMATHSRVLAWRIPWTEDPGGLRPWGCKESDTTEWLTHVLEWVAISSQGIFPTQGWGLVSCVSGIAGRFFFFY